MSELILLTDFWNDPNEDHYKDCMDYLYKSKGFDPFEKYIEKVNFDLEERNFENVIKAFKETRQLSLYMLDKVCYSYRMLQNSYLATKYFTRYSEVAQVLLTTGDGSRVNPYKCIYGSDSRELIKYLNETYSRHYIIDYEDKKLEMVITKSKKEYFFDVTDLQSCKEEAVQDRVDDMIKWFDTNTNRPV